MSTQNLLQAGRTQYDGPKSQKAIIEQIRKDCRQQMSYDFIERVIGLFFTTHGITKYMINGENFSIATLGSFILTKQGRSKRERLRLKGIESARLSHNKKMRKYLKKRRAQNALKKVNNNRAEIGMKPLDFNIFLKITNRKL